MAIEEVFCSIDRLTILAESWRPNGDVVRIKKYLSERYQENHEIALVDYKDELAFGVAFSEWDDERQEDKQENLIFVHAFTKGDVSDVRVDFNPNSLARYGVEYVWKDLKYVISLLGLRMRLSRFDLAFDIINAPEIQQMQNIRGGVTRKEFYGRSGALETVYWGSQSSTVQVRLYDKKTELGGLIGDFEYSRIETDARGFYKIQIKDLWRLEMQMRTKVIDENLADEVLKRLNDFSMTSPYALNLKPELFAFAAIFLSRPGDIPLAFGHVPERTVRLWKSKVRKAVREASDEYTDKIKQALQRDSEKLAEELQRYCNIYLGF